MGEQVDGDKVVTTDYFHCLGCKLATNSFQTVIHRMQDVYWGVRLKTNALLGGDLDINESHIVDIGNYIPSSIRAQIHRNDEICPVFCTRDPGRQSYALTEYCKCHCILEGSLEEGGGGESV